jgi:hypothetical protein
MSAEAYWDLIERTGKGCYYLWGPIRNALLMEFTEGNKELISSICTDGPLAEDRRMPVERKDMLIQVLTIAGQEHTDKVCELLMQMIQSRSRWQRPVEPRSFTEAKKVAAQVAGQLRLSDVLKQLMLDKDEDVRRTAVRSAYYLWKEEKSSGKQNDESLSAKILRDLGDPEALSRWVIPSARQLQSCFELSLSILFEDHSNPETTAFLRATWADILGKILWQRTSHGDGRQSHSARAVKLARSFALSKAVGLALGLAKNLEEERKSVYDISELEQFFKSSETVKKRFSRLIPYIRPGAGSLEDIKSDLKQVAASRDILSCYLLLLILAAHILVRPGETAAAIRELFEQAIEVEPGLPVIPMLLIALNNASDGKDADEIDAGILQLEEEIIIRYQERHDSISQGQTGVPFVYSGLSGCPQYSYRKYGRVNRDMLDVFVSNAKSDDGYDPKKIHNYIVNVAVPGHPQYRDIGAILESLEPILEIALKDEELQDDLIDALARIQAYAPSKVDYFMDLQAVPGKIQEKIRNKSSEEEMATAVIGVGVFFVRDAILRKPDSQLSQMFIQWFEQASVCKSLAEWISSVGKIVLNALCDDELFQL